MLKSFLAAVVLAGAVFFSGDAFAQRAGDTYLREQGCNLSGCWYEIMTYFPGGPNGGWRVTGRVFIPNYQNPNPTNPNN